MSLTSCFQIVRKSTSAALYSKWTHFVKLRQFFLMYLKKFYWLCDSRRISISVAIVVIAALAIVPLFTEKTFRYVPCQAPPIAHNPDRFKLDNSGPPFDEEIVPNIIHFYRTGQDAESLPLVDCLCLMAAYHFARPEKIMIHTDDVDAVKESFSLSQYGKRLLHNSKFKKILEIHYWPAPKHVFGIEFSAAFRELHVKHVTRLRILRKYGGIFLDNNAYLLQNPKQLRHYEMAFVESTDGLPSNDMITAHRDGRMLDLWLKSYHRYDPSTELHHLSSHVLALFEMKTTLAHRFQKSVKSGGVQILIDNNGLLAGNFDTYYVLAIDTRPDAFADSAKAGTDNDYLFTLIEKRFNES